MLCNCCFKDVQKRYKVIESKDTYEILFDLKDNIGDIDLCSWCLRIINKIDKFRKIVLGAQRSFKNFELNDYYNLKTKIFINHYDEVLNDNGIIKVETVKVEDNNTSQDEIVLEPDIDEFSDDSQTDKNWEDLIDSDVITKTRKHKKLSIDRSPNDIRKKTSNSKTPSHHKPKIQILQQELGQEATRIIKLHSYNIEAHNLITTNIPALGEKYGFQILTDDEIQRDIKIKDEDLLIDIVKYKCLLCHQSFKDEQQQNEHVLVHQHRPNSVLCKFCNIWIDDDRNTVMSHYREHYVLYSCKECPYTHPNIKEVSMHYSKSHAKFKCQRCNKVFDSRGCKNYHILKEHRGASLQCNQCGKLFSTIISLKNHMEIHNTKSYTCDICGKAFPSNSKYQYHRNVIHLNVTHIQCEGCEKVFKHKSSYNKHMRETSNHRSERKKFKCSYCDNEYLGEAQMKLHVNVVHFGVGLTCYICGKLCQTRSTLNRHVKSHGDRSDRTRDHICDHCGKTFFTKQQLKEHMNIHSDDRPRKCKLCNATFKFKASLYTHINLVHKKIKRCKL